MASTSVLDTYELLERILLHLPLRTLVLSQRVNKAWSDVFHRSQGIQCACFLKAASSPLDLREQPAKEDREFRPLQYVDDKGELAGPPILNPFTIMRHIITANTDRTKRRALSAEKFVFYGFQAYKAVDGFFCLRECADRSVKEVDGGYKMLLTHPPVKEVLILKTGIEMVSIRSEDGVTQKHLYRYGASDWEGMSELLQDVKDGRSKI